MYQQGMAALKEPDTSISVTIAQVDDEGNDMPPIVKTLKIAHTAGRIIFFAKVDTVPRGPYSDGEDSYFLLDVETVRQIYVDLFK